MEEGDLKEPLINPSVDNDCDNSERKPS